MTPQELQTQKYWVGDDPTEEKFLQIEEYSEDFYHKRRGVNSSLKK
jgi:hypothetical protein